MTLKDHLDRGWQVPVLLHAQRCPSPLSTVDSFATALLEVGQRPSWAQGSVLLAQSSLHSLEATTHTTGFLWVTVSLTGSQHETERWPLGAYHVAQALESECQALNTCSAIY